MRFNGLVLDKQNTLENNNMNSICNLHLKSFAVCFLVLFFVFLFLLSLLPIFGYVF